MGTKETTQDKIGNKLNANNDKKLEKKTNLLLGLFVAAIIAANLLGSKITHLGFIEFSVGIFAFPLTFVITDIIEEVHGKAKTKEFVRVAFICVVFVLLMAVLAVSLPFADRSYVQAEQYNRVFGMSIRFFIASVTAFILSQTHDIWAFNFWKEKTKGKYLWLRNNLSTIISQLIDTVVFMFIALFYLPFDFIPQILNTSPKFTVAYLFALIIPYWLLKVVIAIVDTPAVYAGVYWMRGYVYPQKKTEKSQP
ncbi:MAG: queuosine precursor transporter [Candidatus Woesearchaeota archaeon]|jgi:hypothetical protein|nr:queuosine precursor transporter [Candidatus Woesearchaeota archaeon]